MTLTIRRILYPTLFSQLDGRIGALVTLMPPASQLEQRLFLGESARLALFNERAVYFCVLGETIFVSRRKRADSSGGVGLM